MRSALTAAALAACLLAALAVRLRGSDADPGDLPLPPGLGGSALPAGATLHGELRLPACARPVGYAVIPAHEVSVDPGLVAGGGRPGRTVVVYGGMGMPEAFTAGSVDALHLARRLTEALGLSRASFGSTFVVRFAVPAGCDGLTASDLAGALAPPDPSVSVP